MHGGGPPVTAGTPLAPEYKEENVDLVEKGMCNLRKHIENTAQYGIPVIVAINKFASDTDTELSAIQKGSLEAGRHHRLPIFPLLVVHNILFAQDSEHATRQKKFT